MRFPFPFSTARGSVQSMAAVSPLKPAPLLVLRPSSPSINSKRSAPLITCGPRDNRGPLVRGRTLSTEAILAVQALKRARGDDSKLDQIVSHTLSRLIKADLLAALAELQRQDQWLLALKVFVAARREPWYKPDYSLYAQMVSVLSRSGVAVEIDALVSDLLEEKGEAGISSGDMTGLARLVKALIAAGRGKAVRDVYGMIKRSGCEPDEFLFRILIRGLRGLGEVECANEVQKDFEMWYNGGVRASTLPVR